MLVNTALTRTLMRRAIADRSNLPHAETACLETPRAALSKIKRSRGLGLRAARRCPPESRRPTKLRLSLRQCDTAHPCVDVDL
jgi:hypothetical protein